MKGLTSHAAFWRCWGSRGTRASTTCDRSTLTSSSCMMNFLDSVSQRESRRPAQSYHGLPMLSRVRFCTHATLAHREQQGGPTCCALCVPEVCECVVNCGVDLPGCVAQHIQGVKHLHTQHQSGGMGALEDDYDCVAHSCPAKLHVSLAATCAGVNGIRGTAWPGR